MPASQHHVLLTTGQGQVGNLRFTKDGGAALRVKSGTVARTDTAAKDLFTLPAGAILDALLISGPASNAGTTATLSVGKSGTPTHFVNARDVKTAATGAGLQVPAQAANMGDVGAAAITVTGTYAETGGASNAGGPWTVTALFHQE